MRRLRNVRIFRRLFQKYQTQFSVKSTWEVFPDMIWVVRDYYSWRERGKNNSETRTPAIMSVVETDSF